MAGQTMMAPNQRKTGSNKRLTHYEPPRLELVAYAGKGSGANEQKYFGKKTQNKNTLIVEWGAISDLRGGAQAIIEGREESPPIVRPGHNENECKETKVGKREKSIKVHRKRRGGGEGKTKAAQGGFASRMANCIVGSTRLTGRKILEKKGGGKTACV